MFFRQVHFQPPPQYVLQIRRITDELQTACGCIVQRKAQEKHMSRNTMIGGYLIIGDLDSARNVFDEMPKINIATWNAGVAGLTQFEFRFEFVF